MEPSVSTGYFMGQIQSHSQGKDQSLPAGFSEADLHKYWGMSHLFHIIHLVP